MNGADAGITWEPETILASRPAVINAIAKANPSFDFNMSFSA
jgi:hypothetical protein